MFENLSSPTIQSSRVSHDGTDYALAQQESGEHLLAVAGDTTGFSGQHVDSKTLLAPLTAENADVLRQRLPWLRPTTLGLRTSAGFGDRLGLAIGVGEMKLDPHASRGGSQNGLASRQHANRHHGNYSAYRYLSHSAATRCSSAFCISARARRYSTGMTFLNFGR